MQCVYILSLYSQFIIKYYIIYILLMVKNTHSFQNRPRKQYYHERRDSKRDHRNTDANRQQPLIKFEEEPPASRNKQSAITKKITKRNNQINKDSIKLQEKQQKRQKGENKQKEQKKQTDKETKQVKNQVKKQKDQNQQQRVHKIKDHANTKKARIIVRNLVYDVNEKHLRKLLGKFGEIKQIIIPQHPDKNIGKGFAFVEFVKKNHSLKAIKALNQTKYKGRSIILDMAVPKQNFMTTKINTNNQVEKEGDVKSEDLQQEQNIVKQEVIEDIEQEGDDDNQQQDNEKSQQNQQSDPQVKKQQLEQADYNKQIFIRNLPISLTEEELHKIFRKHGKLSFAKLVMNKQTNSSKGTAFIKFHDQQIAHKLIEYSRSYQMFVLKKHRNFQVDPNIKLEVDGMIMKIFPVQSRKQISTKLQDRKQEENKPELKKKPLKKVRKVQDLIKNDPKDKRRIALALQGHWRVQQTMNERDQQKFRGHERQKLQKLKNPNNSVSNTRIILKYLTKSITQQEIKQILHKFLSQNNYSHTSLTFCKLMLDASRQKSAGFAFVQFRKHQISQKFIDYICANPNIVMSHPFVIQYAIQDSKALLKMQNRNKRKQPNVEESGKKEVKKNIKYKTKPIKKNGKVKQSHTKIKIRKNV